MAFESHTRLRDIFFAALDLRGDERAKYLAEACGTNKEMLAEIERLLAADTGNSTQTALPPERPGETRSNPIEVAGQVLEGRYKLLERIGEGGMGSVWLAQQSEPVKRLVAVKLIKLGMDSRQVLGRFEAERQALALMDHPNIAKVHDGGLTPDGRPFFVMELVKGTPITEYCDAQRLNLNQRLELFVQVCQAIQHAHQKGIIHRDIKPANVLIAMYDDRAVPKVIDFGIAKATGQALTEQTLNTGFGGVVGTPQYMSPEQATLNNLDIDTRSDVYSLGVLLYELMTGSPPFTKKELENKGLIEMLRVVREDEPPKPSTRLSTADALPSLSANRSIEPRRLTAMLRSELDWVVLKAIEKNRTRRYETANGFAADVLRYLAGEPVTAHPPSVLYRTQKFVARNRLQVVAAALVLLALLMGVTGTAMGLIGAKHQAARAVAGEKLAGDRLVEVAAQRDAKELALKNAQQIVKFLSDVFQSPDPTRDGRTITVAELLDRAAKRLDADLSAQPAEVVTLQQTLGASYYALGLSRQAIPLQEQVRNYDEKKLGADAKPTLTAMNDLAASYFGVGRRDEAISIAEKLLPADQKVFGAEDPETLEAMNNLAAYYDDAGRLKDALALDQAVLGICEKHYGPEHDYTLNAMNQLAVLYNETGRLDDAIQLLEKELVVSRKSRGPEHPDTIRAMSNLAIDYDEASRLDESIAMDEQVLKIRTKVLGLENPETLVSMNNLAVSYSKAGRWDDTLKMQQQVLDLRRKTLGVEHGDTLMGMNNLAMTYFHLKLFEKAEALLRESLSIRQRVQPRMWKTFNTQFQLGTALLDQKKYVESEPLLAGGYEGMKATDDQVPPSARAGYPRAVDHLIEVNTVLKRSDDVKKWQTERAKYPPAASRPAR